MTELAKDVAPVAPEAPLRRLTTDPLTLLLTTLVTVTFGGGAFSFNNMSEKLDRIVETINKLEAKMAVVEARAAQVDPQSFAELRFTCRTLEDRVKRLEERKP